MLFDLPLAELRVYKPSREEPSDFDAFWAGTLADARSHALEAGGLDVGQIVSNRVELCSPTDRCRHAYIDSISHLGSPR